MVILHTLRMLNFLMMTKNFIPLVERINVLFSGI